MTKDEALKLTLEALESNKQKHNYCEDTWYSCPKHEDGCANEAEGAECNCGADEINAQFDKAITAIKEALAQPEQKYHRGDRLICLETEEYCVIHISGTDRQWVKFPDSHIGVYTNEQVAELFELLPKEPEQGPVAWMFQHDETGRMNYVSNDGIHDPTMFLGMNPRYALVYPLYTTPPQPKEPEQEPIGYVNEGETDRLIAQKQETIEGLNRDYDLLFAEHQLLLKKEWIELTDEEILEVWKENEKVYPMDRSRLLDRTRACIRKAQNK